MRLLGFVKLSSVVDPEPFIQNVLGAHDAVECHECHWAGRTSDLRRETDARGGTELVCPNCSQARYIFPPKE